ncbi:MAG: hypothetical protein AB1442_16290 [Nitrospirota bacterium]
MNESLKSEMLNRDLVSADEKETANSVALSLSKGGIMSWFDRLTMTPPSLDEVLLIPA